MKGTKRNKPVSKPKVEKEAKSKKASKSSKKE